MNTCIFVLSRNVFSFQVSESECEYLYFCLAAQFFFSVEAKEGECEYLYFCLVAQCFFVSGE